MIKINRDAVTDAMDEAGLDPDSDLRTDYSGRYRYGDTTFGIVGSDAEFAEFLVHYAKTEGWDGDTALELAQRVRSDNMGRSMIFYFPGIELAED